MKSDPDCLDQQYLTNDMYILLNVDKKIFANCMLYIHIYIHIKFNFQFKYRGTLL